MRPEEIVSLKSSVYSQRAGCPDSLGESIDLLLKQAGTYPLRWTGPELNDVARAAAEGQGDLAIATMIQSNRKSGKY